MGINPFSNFLRSMKGGALLKAMLSVAMECEIGVGLHSKVEMHSLARHRYSSVRLPSIEAHGPS